MITFEILVDDLKKNSSGQKYIDFNKKIVNSKLELIGVKLPVLRKFIKKYKDIDLNTFVPNQYFETNFIYIGVILEKIGSLNEAFKFLFNNKELIDSWAMTDSTYQYIKISSNLDEDINIIDKFLNTDNEFMIRYGYLLFFNYYKQEKSAYKGSGWSDYGNCWSGNTFLRSYIFPWIWGWIDVSLCSWICITNFSNWRICCKISCHNIKFHSNGNCLFPINSYFNRIKRMEIHSNYTRMA